MSPDKRRALWEAKVLLAACENALQKVESGRLEQAEEALIRVEGMATRAKMAVRQARNEVAGGYRVG